MFEDPLARLLTSEKMKCLPLANVVCLDTHIVFCQLLDTASILSDSTRNVSGFGGSAKQGNISRHRDFFFFDTASRFNFCF